MSLIVAQLALFYIVIEEKETQNNARANVIFKYMKKYESAYNFNVAKLQNIDAQKANLPTKDISDLEIASIQAGVTSAVVPYKYHMGLKDAIFKLNILISMLLFVTGLIVALMFRWVGQPSSKEEQKPFQEIY